MANRSTRAAAHEPFASSLGSSLASPLGSFPGPTTRLGTSGSAAGRLIDVGIHPVSGDPSQFGTEGGERNVGVCFSGGGSRSLSAVLGQLRGLRQMGWLDKVHALSAVSGGCWAAAVYTYLPDAISDDEFLGAGVPPEELRWEGGDAASLSHLAPNSLGQVAVRMGWEALFRVFGELVRTGFVDTHQWWRAAIGELVFREYGLYETDGQGNPTRSYAWSEAQFERTIRPFNPELRPSDFYFARSGRPWLIMNGAMFYPGETMSLVPFVSTPAAAGIRAAFPQVGGGFVDAFGFGSQFAAKTSLPLRVKVWQERPFSLADMASISSAAFAAAFWDRFGLKELEPEYVCWPVAGGGSKGKVYTFADGGLLDGTGLVNLLANTRVTKAAVFVNGTDPVRRAPYDPRHLQVPDSIPPLFGLQPDCGLCENSGYPPYQGDPRPRQPLMRHNQIFPSERFRELQVGLNQAAGDFERTAIYLQTDLELMENPWYGIGPRERRRVDVLWVCNNRVGEWERRITDPVIRKALDERHVPESELWNFPYYGTLTQLHLTRQQVNMLAQLSWWNVVSESNRDAWTRLFG